MGCLFWFLCGQLQFQWWKAYWKNIWQEQGCNLSYDRDTHEVVGNLFFGDFRLRNGFTIAFVVTVAVDLDSEGHKRTVKIINEIKKCNRIEQSTVNKKCKEKINKLGRMV